MHNAYKNALIARDSGLEPIVWFVAGKIKHAYLEVEGTVLNQGVTWGTDNYPDFTAEQIRALQEKGVAEDITSKLDRSFNEGELYRTKEGSFPLHRSRIERSF